MQYAAWAMGALLLVYFAVELGWGGGRPKGDPHHNPLDHPFW
jgi:hypothetical protein